MCWFYLYTSYKIEVSFLYYSSGFLRGKIDISSMDEISQCKMLWSGVRPALALNGLLIKYNK